MNARTQQHGRLKSRQMAVIALTTLVVVLGVLWVWNAQSRERGGNTSGTAPSGAAIQTNEGGQVTVIVTWHGKRAGPVFSVEMDTHAVDLDGYDLRQLAVLRLDQGQEIASSSWNALAGGHHRTGTLGFPATHPDGTPVIGPKTQRIELVIRNVSGVPERIFQWRV